MRKIFIIIILISIIIDQGIKKIVLMHLDQKTTICGGLVEFVLEKNRGIAFGMFQGYRYFFVLASCIAIFYFIYIIFIKGLQDKLFIISSGLVIGGGLGNLIDRIFRGFVVDYVKLIGLPFVFNFADACITAGGALLIIYFYLNRGSKVFVDE